MQLSKLIRYDRNTEQKKMGTVKISLVSGISIAGPEQHVRNSKKAAEGFTEPKVTSDTTHPGRKCGSASCNIHNTGHVDAFFIEIAKSRSGQLHTT